MAIATAALIIGAVAAVAAGGLSYYSSVEQADTAQQVAAYNAAVQRQQADMTSAIQVRQAEINQSMLRTQINQTRATDQQANAVVDQARDQQRRLRDEKMRLLGTQAAGYAKGGVISEGTPLAVFADTEFNYALQENDIFKTADEQSTALHRQAQLDRLGLNSQLQVEQLNANAARAGKVIGYDNSALTLAQGASTAQAYRLAGYGTLLSTAGSVASSYAQAPRKTGTIPVAG
jgi:hypothetical protein